jgi:hypothetical protein
MAAAEVEEDHRSADQPDRQSPDCSTHLQPKRKPSQGKKIRRYHSPNRLKLTHQTASELFSS